MENNATFTDIKEQEISICTFPHNKTTHRLLFYIPYILFSIGFYLHNTYEVSENLDFTSTKENK